MMRLVTNRVKFIANNTVLNCVLPKDFDASLSPRELRRKNTAYSRASYTEQFVRI